MGFYGVEKMGNERFLSGPVTIPFMGFYGVEWNKCIQSYIGMVTIPFMGFYGVEPGVCQKASHRVVTIPFMGFYGVEDQHPGKKGRSKSQSHSWDFTVLRTHGIDLLSP